MLTRGIRGTQYLFREAVSARARQLSTVSLEFLEFRGISRVVDVHWLAEFSIAQAVWVLEVENFGPLLVESDLDGNSLFERENRKISGRIERLYDGLKPPTLGRYGETTSRDDEVI